jgi:hypothetical protein
MNTDIYTYFTNATGLSELLYSAEGWVRVGVRLETAGPVVVGTRDSVTPVLSGKGILLPSSGDTVTFTLPKGNRLFIAAESINRVKFVVEPIPWLEQILFNIENGFGGVKGLLAAALRRGPGGTKNVKIPEKHDPDCPPPFTVPNIWRKR